VSLLSCLSIMSDWNVRIRKSRLLGAVLVLCVGNLMTGSELPANGPAASRAGYDRPAGDPKQGRSTVIARSAMVATSHPLAAQVGLDILRSGGNAADAAIAANAMLGLVEPMSCGIGGDLFVLYWDARSKQLFGLNASGRAPAALTRKVLADKGLSEIPIDGPLSWTVPGCVDGWAELRQRFGTRKFSEILAPAIKHAEEGFPVSEIIGAGWAASAESLAKWPDSGATYLIDGRAPAVGEIFKNPRLANTYRAIGESGRVAFYNGPITHKIISFSQANGGYFALKDFTDHRSEWVEPVSTTYRDCEVWQLPPNGQGLAVLEMLNLLEPYNIREMGHNSASYLHLLIEAKKLAFADRARFYADPAMANVPVAQLISKEYAERQRKRINPNKAAVDVPAGAPVLREGDTIYLCVVDREGNCCSFIQSNYYGFGSQMVPGDLGFALQNRGALFSLDPQHPNSLEPGKRPFHTIIPGMATKEGKPWLVFGVMGGDMQPQGHVQVLVNMIDFGMNPQLAGDAARVRHAGSATPTGKPMEPGGGTVHVESGVSDDVVQKLIDRGHKVVRGQSSFGGYQAILIDPQHGTLHGGTDSRKDGAAVGY
jgi:gamma-glutamyltranspeptidase / glutathione hydrolase